MRYDIKRTKTVTFRTNSKDFYKIIDQARELSDEIRENRPAHKISATCDEAMIGEVVFSKYLDSKGIEWKRPQDEDGNFRDENNSDYGDFEIEGLVYDVKIAQPQNRNTLITKSAMRDCIDYFVGAKLEIDEWNNQFILRIFGIVHIEDVIEKSYREIECKGGEPGYLIRPQDHEEI